MKKFSLVILAIFFIVAGANHFVNPAFYLPLIPPYLPFHEAINIFSGIIEIVLGAGLLLKLSRKYAALGIVVLMALFIPSHIYFVQMGSCIGSLCTEQWVGWVRLVLIHPLLIIWAFYHFKK